MHWQNIRGYTEFVELQVELELGQFTEILSLSSKWRIWQHDFILFLNSNKFP